ncbi:isochorismatase hydrolase [Thozetella sp. PMI_491]|nr:isochorismatase hydrolase [Thozetella sp. PMI_491]
MAKAALLVMDVQNGVLKMANASESYFQRLAATTAGARAAGLPVIYIKSFLRKGFPDASSRNKVVSRVASLGPDVFVEGSPFTEFPPEVVPVEGDAIVVKRRNSSFAGTDLEVLLRSQGIEHILLLGVMTSGVVLSTVRQAADLDYQITVIEDLCLDVNPDVHQLLMTKVFPMQASVVSSEAAIKGL